MSITVNQVTLSISRKDILSDINGQFSSGKVTAIIGPNGSGKTSLLKLLAGHIKPTQGSVCIAKKNVATYAKRQLAKQLTVLPQSSPRPLGMTVYDLVSCGRFPHVGTWKPFTKKDKDAVSSAIHKTDLNCIQHNRIDYLSGGEMQRVWLAMVLCQETPYLLLDEPISYLDIAHQIELLELIKDLNKSEGKTIVWVLHDLNQAMQFSDDIWMMHEGKLVSHGVAEKVMDSTLIRKVFGVETKFLEIPGLTSPLMTTMSLSASAKLKLSPKTHLVEETLSSVATG